MSLEALRSEALACELEVRATLPLSALSATVMDRVDRWLQQGRAGCMDYLPRQRPLMESPAEWKPWARSVTLFAVPYSRAAGGFAGGGNVARYALGADYHNRLGRRLQRLGRGLRRAGISSAFRACTDAAPLLEREWAIRGGVGWRGKNTLLLDPQHGPWVLLGELLLDCELPEYTAPRTRVADCGSCVRCLEACPTKAFTAPFELDPRLCVSYLTIENRGPIPRPLRTQVGAWVFGCDVCLEVCPFGHHSGDHAAAWGLHDGIGTRSLESVLEIPQADFATIFAGSTLRRAGWEGLLRNVCVVLGNLGRGGAALENALAHHPSALVRGHAAWALGCLQVREPLRERLRFEDQASVIEEIHAALAN